MWTGLPAVTARAYRFFGRTVRVDCDDPAVADLLDAIYDRQRVDDAADPGRAALPDLVVAVRADGPGGPRVELGGRTVRAPSAGELAHHAHLVLVNAAAALADGRRVLHAGAVARDGRAVLIVGRSGWGKTTQTLALVQRGWRLLSDDFAVVRADGTVEPFVRRVNLTTASLDLLDLAPPPGSPIVAGFGGRVKWMVDVEQLWPDRLGGPARLAAVCLLASAASSTPPAGPWRLEVDHLPAGFVADLAAIPGVASVAPATTPDAHAHHLVIHTAGAARIVAAVDRVCAAHDVAVLSAHAGAAAPPDFGPAPALDPIDPAAALDALLVHDLSLAGRRFLFGTHPPDVLAARAALRTAVAACDAAVYRLSPGPVAATADLIAGLLDDAGDGAR